MNITLYHRPGTRSERTKRLLELMALPFELREVGASDAETPAYRALNPFGTVPTLDLDGRILVESAGQLMALADLRPEAGLAPKPGTMERALYYDGFVFAVATLEPAFVAWMERPKDAEREARRDRALRAMEERAGTPFAVGGRLTALDVLLHWQLAFLATRGLLEHCPRSRAGLEGITRVLTERGVL
ncbi:MAG: glutathione S-transferase [Myxococcota bacterium]